MADETATRNSVVASEEDDQLAEEFYNLDQGEQDAKLKQKMESLQQEKILLVRENEEIKDQMIKLTAEIESLRSCESDTKLKLVEMEREVEQSEDSKRAVESIAARAGELETAVCRLQHDLISSMTEGEEAKTEILELKRALGEKEVKIEEIKKDKADTEKRVRELERKIGVLEVKEIEEKSKKVRMEEEIRDKMVEKEEEISGYKKKIEELENEVIKKERLEGKLRQSEEKTLKMEGKIVALQKQLKDAEKLIVGLKERSVEFINGIEIESGEKGFKGHWPAVALGSTGAIVAAAGLTYLFYAKRS